MRGLTRVFAAVRAAGMVGIAVGGSLAGIAVLYLMVQYGETPETDIADLGSHEGENVAVVGALVRESGRSGAGADLTVYDDGRLLRVSCEQSPGALGLHSLVRATGQATLYRGEWELSCSGAESVEPVGEWSVPVWPASVGEYCAASGTVIHIERSWDGSVESASLLVNGSRLDVYLELPREPLGALPELELCDEVRAAGIVSEYSNRTCLRVLDPRAVGVAGRSAPRELAVGEVSAELAELAACTGAPSNGSDVLSVSGYVRYEPAYAGSLVLGEALDSSKNTLKVELDDTRSAPEVHMGDLVRLYGSLSYDPGSMRYVFVAGSCEVVSACGPVNATASALAADPSVYEGACVRVCGSLETDASGAWVLADSGVCLPLEASQVQSEGLCPGIPCTVVGTWSLDPLELRYMLVAESVAPG